MSVIKGKTDDLQSSLFMCDGFGAFFMFGIVPGLSIIRYRPVLIAARYHIEAIGCGSK